MVRFAARPALALVALLACRSESSTGTDDAAVGSASKADELDDGTTAAAATIACATFEEALDVRWPQGGPGCSEEADVVVHRYDDDTFILRQSLCTSFEAPFIYMLFGEDRVLVEDSGAGGVAMFEAVRGVVDTWLADRGRTDDIEIVLVNSHAHGDHVAGNDQFEDKPGVTVVGFGVPALEAFFRIDWPGENAELDLGGRIVDVVPIPGHEASHIALYDRREGLLLTGDAFYPGRLFIDDFADYVASTDKLVAFAEGSPVCWILGTHIEMSSTPGVDFEFGSTHHPDEHVLPLTVDHLRELADALHAMNGTPVRETHDDFIVFPL